MNSHLSQAVAQSRQQDVLRGAERQRLARDLPRRPSPLARFMNATASLKLARRHSTELPQTAPAPN